MLLRIAAFASALYITAALAQTCTPETMRPPRDADVSNCDKGTATDNGPPKCIIYSGGNRCAYGRQRCFAGYYSFADPTFMTNGVRCLSCLAFSKLTWLSSLQNQYYDCQACPAGQSSPAQSTSSSRCRNCAKGTYSTGDGGACTPCPDGSTTASTGSTSMSQCNVCMPGYEPNVSREHIRCLQMTLTRICSTQ